MISLEIVPPAEFCLTSMSGDSAWTRTVVFTRLRLYQSDFDLEHLAELEVDVAQHPREKALARRLQLVPARRKRRKPVRAATIAHRRRGHADERSSRGPRR